MSQRLLSIALTAFLLASATVVVLAGEYNRVLDIGDRVTGWSALPGVDGKSHSLDDLKDAKAVVVVFTGTGCPVAMAYEERLNELANRYRDRGVVLVAINVNPGEDLEKMRERSKAQSYSFAYIRDDSQQVARDFGATCTPHAFLLNDERQVAYMGAIDDNWLHPADVQQAYLKNAIEAVLAGQAPDITEKRQVGCGIKWSK